MADTRLPASGAIRVRWHAANAFANDRYPSVAELNAGLDISDSISWNDYSFGIESSNTITDPAITAKSNVSDRGAAQYGGTLSFYHPRVKEDTTNVHALTYAALKVPRTIGYVSISIDGDLSETNTPLYPGGATRDYADGDYVHVLKVITAAYSDAATGEEAYRYTINFRPQGRLAVYTVAGAGPAEVEATPSTVSASAGDAEVITATVNGRPYTRGLRWTTSDSDVATVSQNGIVTAVADGTATITATFEATGASDDVAVTVA